MKKLTAFVLVIAICISVVPTVLAYEAGDPCLLYGYDPDTRDDYETYGDEVFLRYNNVKSPTGDMFIWLNEYASNKIVTEAETYNEFWRILSKEYFPELDIHWIYCDSFLDKKTYESDRKNFIEKNKMLYITLQLRDNSKETLVNAMKNLAPRCDIDIHQVLHISYDLTDVSTALKAVAGWNVSCSVFYDYNQTYHGLGDTNNPYNIDLKDVTVMLKSIAKWENNGWFWKSRGFKEVPEDLI